MRVNRINFKKLDKMRTLCNKRVPRSPVKTFVGKGIHSTTVVLNGLEPRIILYDIMQPVVLLKKIKLPPQNNCEETSATTSSSDDSSPGTSVSAGSSFKGFESDDLTMAKDAIDKEIDDALKTTPDAGNDTDDVKTESPIRIPSVLESLVSKYLPAEQIKSCMERIKVHLATAPTQAFDDMLDESSSDEEMAANIDDCDADDAWPEETPVTADNTIQTNDANMSADNIDGPDMNSGQHIVDENVVDENVTDGHDDQFYDADDNEYDEFGQRTTMFGPDGGNGDQFRLIYDSDDSWNSVDESHNCQYIPGSIDGSQYGQENVNTLLSFETMDDSLNSCETSDDEYQDSSSFENDQPLLTDILELIVSNDAANRTENGEAINSIYLFDNVCIRNLNDCCYDIQCRFKHSLPSNESVQRNLETARFDEVNEAYNDLLVCYPKLFDRYFPAFCAYYSKQRIRTQLRDMSHECASSVHAKCFMQEIVNGFCATNMPYHVSVDVLVNQSISHGNDPRYQMLVLNVAMDWKNSKLLEHLQRFQEIFIDENRVGHTEAIEKLIRLNAERYDEALATFTLEVLRKCPSRSYIQSNEMSTLQTVLKTIAQRGHRDGHNILQRIIAARSMNQQIADSSYSIRFN